MKNNILNADSYHPLYYQLMQKLRDDISSGVYPVSSRIPSEQVLCETYSISRVTVRKALSDLVKEGLLIRHQGKGTFVSGKKLVKDLKSITSFTNACRSGGAVLENRVLHIFPDVATEEDAAALQLKNGDKVLEICRLRLLDGSPVMMETNRFSSAYAFLEEQDLTGSLYALLEKHGVTPAKAVHDISLCYANQQQAKYLEVEMNEALLFLSETVYDSTDRPIHTSRQYIRGDKFTFRI